MRPRPLAVVALFLLAWCATAPADEVRLKNGGTLRGVILRETADGVIIRLKHTTATVPRSEIASVERAESDGASEAGGGPLPGWERCLQEQL